MHFETIGETEQITPDSTCRYGKPLTPAQIAAARDKNIDFSDIPELDEAFWREAELIEPDLSEQITMRVKRSVLEYFKAPGR